MWTAMHEAGHALMGEDLSVEEEHNVGYVYDRGSYYHRSPMGHGGDASENDCGDWSLDHTDDCEEMHWNDDCCVNQ